MKFPTWLDPYTEPARLRAVWAAVVGLLAALGINLTADYHNAVEALIVLVGVAVPLIQGSSTRAAVHSPASHDAAVARAARR